MDEEKIARKKDALTKFTKTFDVEGINKEQAQAEAIKTWMGISPGELMQKIRTTMRETAETEKKGIGITRSEELWKRNALGQIVEERGLIDQLPQDLSEFLDLVR